MFLKFDTEHSDKANLTLHVCGIQIIFSEEFILFVSHT
jgi:hypothetical protein